MHKSKTYFYIIILLLTTTFAYSKENNEIDKYYPHANQIDTILHNGLMRTFKLYVPDSYSTATKTALVIALHGYGNTATEMEETSQLNNKADSEGFIVVYPDGWNISDNDNSTQVWNDGGNYRGEILKKIDDVGFIHQMIELICKYYSIEQNNIYATGFSNGASMSYRLGCELSCKIAAIAPHSGYINYKPSMPDCTIPVLHLQGMEDGIVPYYNGLKQSIADMILNYWASQFSCNPQSDTSFNNSDFLIKEWNCSEYNAAKLYVSIKGRHDWFTTSNSGIQANDIIWEFFKEHPKKP